MVRKYRKLYREIKNKILQGTFPPGQSVPSQRALAKLGNVNNLTASRALDELERDGYVVRRPSRGTFVAQPNTWQQKSQSVGKDEPLVPFLGILLFARDPDDPAYAAIISEIVRIASQNGITAGWWTVNSFGVSDQSDSNINQTAENCDAYVFLGPVKKEDLLESLWRGRPAVVIASKPCFTCFNCVSNKIDLVNLRYDDAAIVMVKHMIDLGHKRIGIIDGDSGIDGDYGDFKEGYRSEISWHHLEYDTALVRLIENPIDPDAGYEAAKSLLALQDAPTAILCITDRLAYGVYRAAHELGLSIPNDCSVTSCEGLPFSSSLNPPLTTLKDYRPEMIESGMALLLERLKNPDCDARNVEIKPELVVRASTAAISAV